jgi:hypothetical protein
MNGENEHNLQASASENTVTINPSAGLKRECSVDIAKQIYRASGETLAHRKIQRNQQISAMSPSAKKLSPNGKTASSKSIV